MELFDSDFDIKEIIRIDKDPLKRESDRGCVLICASNLENKLEYLLTQYFKGASQLGKKSTNEIFDFNGALGTFSSKIQISRAMGIIDQDLYNDINKIRKIRNIAAHNDQNFSLSNQKIKEIVGTMVFDHSKTGKLPTYQLVKADRNDVPEDEIENETLMKGYGILRVDKINFIFTYKTIIFELEKLDNVVNNMGSENTKIRKQYLKMINDLILNKSNKA